MPAQQRLLFLDFETYYDREYSLRKMPPPNYILDERYETIMCAVKEPEWPQSMLVDGPEFAKFIAGYDPAVTTTVTFNALFDNCILAWRYGFVPARMYCAMAMARALYGHMLESVALAKVAPFLKVGEKGTEIENVIGMNRRQIIASGRWHKFTQYALQDCDLCEKIFWKLLPEFPAAERRVMDRVLRAAVAPKLRCDIPMLTQHLKDVENEKTALFGGALLMSSGKPFTTQTLSSSTQFAELLKELGVDVQYKMGSAGKLIPAVAKTDEFMADLAEYEDPLVQALAAARLGQKSTIEQTRGNRLISVASLDWSIAGLPPGTLPIPLRYGGAHTHRLSGEWKFNMQNLPAMRGGSKSKLRRSVVPGPDEEVVSGDLSQVEARITAWLCRELGLLRQFADDLDPYSQLGGKIFGCPCGTTKEAIKAWKVIHAVERFIGKSGVLGLGFGCGADKFYNMVIRSARAMKMDVAALKKVFTPEVAQRSVDMYRESNPRIKAAWKMLDAVLDGAWQGKGAPVKFGPCVIGHGYVRGPGGLELRYQVLPDEGQERWYKYGRYKHKIYGAKFLENIVQFLARIVIMNAAMRLWDRGLEFRLQAHDELVFVVKKDKVAEAKKMLAEELRRRPTWAPELPLDCEVGSGPSYGDAK